ncbi:DNA polymerase IV [Lagierella sp.]|uniref:DNA polymerase Y family protein n=1 Tax=Lagierella sp. TaxID=2849657 RepID=UPI00263050E9|nr:DNA polymerase IV [Lagierella sp.]
MNSKERVILHSDLNSFYASVELLNYPKYRGKPFAVGGNQEDRHGIILAKTPEAKMDGVKTGEPIWQAMKKCPNLIVVPPNYEKYLYYSDRVQKVYYSFTKQVEPFGMDECWLDVTGSQRLFGSGKEIADCIRKIVRESFGLTVSIGVSYNKIFAKLGSDLKKPDATTEITKNNFKDIVWPLGCGNMIMVGPATQRKLSSIGIYTLGELANSDERIIKKMLGINGIRIRNWANGKDNTPVTDYYYEPPIKSIGRGITTVEDMKDSCSVQSVLMELCQEVSEKLIEHGFLATGISISIRDNKLQSRNYTARLEYPTSSSIEIIRVAMELFKEYSWDYNIRAVKIRATNIIRDNTSYQITALKDVKEHEEMVNLENAIYKIRGRFGKKSVIYCNMMLKRYIPDDKREMVIMPSTYIAEQKRMYQK